MSIVLITLFISIFITPDISANISRNIVNMDTEYWALLVAVGVYADHPESNIHIMIEDVDRLHNTLLDSDWWSRDHIKVIKGKNATATNIIQGLRWLDRMDDGDDISLIYITSHGGPLSTDIPPLDEEDGHDECLSTYWSFAYPSALLWDDELNLLISSLDSHGVCLIVDSCFAGGFNDPPFTNINSDKIFISEWMNDFAGELAGNGRVVLMACREDEISVPDMFTPRIIDGLRGFADKNHDSVITAEELFLYSEVRCFRQSPTIYDGFPGELPIIGISYDPKSNSEDSIQECYIEHNKELIADENAVVCGYVLDNSTGDPIFNAYVSLVGEDNEGNIFRNLSITDSNGFYHMNVSSGMIILSAHERWYERKITDYYNISEYEKIWVNFSLVPVTMTVCGYITDNVTLNPITNAVVEITCWDYTGEYSFETHTDNSGFFSAGITSGVDVEFVFDAIGYFSEYLWIDDIQVRDVLWINVSLDTVPSERAVVCGFVTFEKDGEPVVDQYVYVNWYGEEGYYSNGTFTDNTGFYRINVAAGDVYVHVNRDGYLHEYDYQKISSFDTCWVNLSLFPIPAKNSFINGYVADSSNGELLEGVYIEFCWLDGYNHHYIYSTRSDSSGFFRKNVAAGEFYITFWENDYCFYRLPRTDVYLDETLWINVSLDFAPIFVDIKKPLQALYLFNKRIIPCSQCVILGDLDVEVFIHDYWFYPVYAWVDKVEFYVDGVLKETLMDSPYVWRWNDNNFGIHTLKVVAYSETGYISGDEVSLWKLF